MIIKERLRLPFSGDKIISIKDLVKLIYKKFNLDYFNYINITPERPGKDSIYDMEDKTSRKELNWQNRFTLDQGLDNTIKWYSEFKHKFSKKTKVIFFKNEKFLLKQYARDKKFKIRHNYLSDQFKDSKNIISKIINVVNYNDFTLGRYVDSLEKKFSKLIGSKYCIGVGSGTDAIFLSLKSLGIKEGDEVITPTFSFYATSGAIATTGAKPVFVDIKDDLNIDEKLIEKKINKKTKAIVPVHWSGRICDMKTIKKIAKKYSLFIVEDACHAMSAHDDKKKFAGTFGDTGCFSFHPLKNLNVWGDGGIIVTNSSRLNKKLKLLRNHGLSGRNNCDIYGYNSRLDTIQAVAMRC